MPRQPIPIECTIDGLVNATPCVNCLSRKELMALLVVILGDLLDYDLPDDIPELLADSACFRCQSDRERFNGLMGKLVNEVRDGYTMDQLRDEIKCILCWDEVTLKSVIHLLFCQTIDVLIDCQNPPQ